MVDSYELGPNLEALIPLLDSKQFIVSYISVEINLKNILVVVSTSPLLW